MIFDDGVPVATTSPLALMVVDYAVRVDGGIRSRDPIPPVVLGVGGGFIGSGLTVVDHRFAVFHLPPDQRFELASVPEPSTLALVLGGGGVWAWRRMRVAG